MISLSSEMAPNSSAIAFRLYCHLTQNSGSDLYHFKYFQRSEIPSAQLAERFKLVLCAIEKNMYVVDEYE
jgi:hypothetical protein